ncbi:MAG: hypothetical protein K9J76_11135 [Polaromonas sp.]|nr:hypothetical protein [Polaromonas sp.]
MATEIGAPSQTYTSPLAQGGPVDAPKGAERTAAGNMAGVAGGAQHVALADSNAGSISNANGSPCIGSPAMTFSPEDLAAQLASLTTKTKDAQTAAAVNGLQLSKQQMEAKTAEGIAKIQEWQTNTIEAAAQAKEAAEQSWFEKICNAVVGVVLTIVTAPLALTGLGTPLFAMALGMAIDSCTACVNNARALEEPPREPLESFGNPLNQLASMMVNDGQSLYALNQELEAAKARGDESEVTRLTDKKDLVGAKAAVITAVCTLVSNPTALMLNPGIVGTLVSGSMKIDLADELEAARASGDPARVQEIENEIYKAEMIATIATTVVVAIAGIAATVLSGGAAAGLLVSNVAKISMAAGEIAMASVNIAKSAMAIETSKLQLGAAESTRDASFAQADAAKIDAKKLLIQKFMEENQEDVKKLVQEIMENATLVSQMINAAGGSRSAIAENFSSGKLNPA